LPDGGTTLDFDEGADFGVVANAALIEIDKIEPPNVSSELDVTNDVALSFDRKSLIAGHRRSPDE
jgi:hypothetical protein